MGAILEKQQIAKRRKIHKPIYKSADSNRVFIGLFSQKTVPIKNKKPIKSIFTKTIRKDRYKLSARQKRAGFTFSIPVLPVLAAISGVFVIGLAAFNWEEINIKLPDSFAIMPVFEAATDNHTINYAFTGIPSIVPDNQADIPVIEDADTEPGINAQNDLITFEWQQYKVRAGDSVSKIASKFGVSVGAVIASNNIQNARALKEGTMLRIPNIDGIPHQIKNGDSLTKIAAFYNVPLEVILDVNDIKSENIRTGDTFFIPGARMNDIDLRLSLGELFMYPVPSRFVTSRYGMRKDPISGVLAFHTGIDLRANTGTTVVAALDGRVSVVGENWLYGKYIIITHDNGYKTLYAHLNSFSVKQGDYTARGRKIGESGNTGYSTGPHLHFSIYDKNNKLVNPLELLR